MGKSTLELSTDDPTLYSYMICSQILIDCSLLNQKYNTDKLIGARKYWEDSVIHSLTIIMHRSDFGLFLLFITKTYSFSFFSIDGVASAFHLLSPAFCLMCPSTVIFESRWGLGLIQHTCAPSSRFINDRYLNSLMIPGHRLGNKWANDWS